MICLSFLHTALITPSFSDIVISQFLIYICVFVFCLFLPVPHLQLLFSSLTFCFILPLCFSLAQFLKALILLSFPNCFFELHNITLWPFIFVLSLWWFSIYQGICCLYLVFVSSSEYMRDLLINITLTSKMMFSSTSFNRLFKSDT